MKAKLVVAQGCVYLRDCDTQQDILAMTATQASWLSYFLQSGCLTSELVVQLRLAAQFAERQAINPTVTEAVREFQTRL